MLALKPRIEFGLPAGATIVPDRQNSGLLRHGLFGRYDRDLDFDLYRRKREQRRVSRANPGLQPIELGFPKSAPCRTQSRGMVNCLLT
jgi:hypothetical protein